MSKWKSQLQNIFEKVEDWSDEVRHRIKKFDEDILITPYMGYGNSEKILLHGRVMEDKGYRDSNETDGAWRNLKNTYRHFETSEIPNALVKASFRGMKKEAAADKEGYFHIEINPTQKPDAKLWHDVELELLKPITNNGQKATAVGQVLIPPITAKFGVISDIDDTILQTNVKNKFKMFLTTILSNAHTRAPFEGVAAFYQALQKGVTGNENNPIFYVSSSPYNLYKFLTKFLEIQEIPLGPIFLKDFGIHTPFTSGDHKTHKLNNIKNVLETYPHLQFVLVGDNGEKDPEIYAQIVKEYPNRIHTIYIREVSGGFGENNNSEKLIRDVQNRGSQLIFTPDSESAASHAARENLISANALSNIRKSKKLNKDSPRPKDVSGENLVNK